MKDGADNQTKEEYENREIENWKLFFLVAKWRYLSWYSSAKIE
jgi:hypothetical protein